MRVLVVGLGGMGSFVAREMLSRGHEVHGYDVSPEARARSSALGVAALAEMPDPSAYDAVVAAVPISSSASLAREVAPRLRAGAIYADLSSLKAEVNAALRAAGAGAVKVSAHPLFGPGAMGMAGRPIALTPVEDEAAELGAAESLFPGAKFIVMGEAEHDDAVAYSIIVPQVIGYLFRRVAGRASKLPAVSGRLQELAAAVEASDPGLTAELLAASPRARSALELLWASAGELRSALLGGDREGLRSLLEEFRGEWPERDELYRLAYRALGAIEASAKD